jgi:hypothetical protein
MTNVPLRILQAILWFAALSHLVIGLGIMASPDFRQSLADFYGARLPSSAEFVYILKPLGAFMVVLGLLAAIAALDPFRHSAVVYGLALLLLLRVGQRFAFQQELQDAFGIDATHNLAFAAFFVVQAVALVGLLHFAKRSSPTG